MVSKKGSDKKRVVGGKKTKKSSNEPKRPLTAYLYYSNERRPILKEKHPDLKVTDLSKLIGEEWNEMTDAQKLPYKEMNEKDKKRYEREKSSVKQ